MMNILALGLVLATLFSAGVHSPAPPLKNQEDVIVKDGHRVVKVEFDEEGHGTTKVSISSNEHNREYVGKSVKDKISGSVGDGTEKLKEASSAMPNLGQGIGYEYENGGIDGAYGERASARELFCDALGKCRHRIANAFGKTKEVVSDTAQEAADKMYEVEEDAKETVTDAMGRVKDSLADSASKTKSRMEGVAEIVKDSVTEKAKQASSLAGDAARSTKSSMEGLADMAKGSVTKTAKQASDLAGDAARNTKSKMEGMAEVAQDSVTEKAKHASDLAGDAARNTKSRIEGGAKEAAEMTRQGVEETTEMVKQKAKRGKDAVGEAIDTTKTLTGDVRRNASEKMEDVSEKVKHGAEKVDREGKKGVEKIRVHSWGLLLSMFDSLRSYMRILQLFGVSTAYGMSMWVTFLSSYVLARVLPRQQFANAQSKIYPIYFKAMAYSVGLALLGHLLSEPKIRNFASLENFQALNLMSSLGMILANLLYFEPRATKVMFERLKWDKEEGRGVHDTPSATTITTTKETEASHIRLVDSVVSPSNIRSVDSAVPPTGGTTTERASDSRPLKIIELSEALKKLNSYSSFLNVLTLMGLTLHLVHLGQRLGTSC